AIQGPNSPSLIEKTLHISAREVKWFRFTTIKRREATLIVARTGYTGEDGFEVIILPEETIDLVGYSTELLQQLLSGGRDYNVKLCGFGARDSLRLEAGLVLYGHEISEEITPLEARLHLFVKFEKESFIGKEPLEKQDLEGLSRVRVGLLMIDPGIPREGYSIVKGERIVGKVTSGGYSPLLKKGIAMALVDTRHAILDSYVYVKIRQRNAKAKIVNWPFYNTAQYGRTRVVK
ncbi:MAG TPA: glycine cleavage system aminomethyltransferase GcvT, partial [Candidatus Methanomethylia archaeon]|nr:glycine cleavage system aminomethyltransferase GcvT [Candidatus Methanomethylicia archaeon]